MSDRKAQKLGGWFVSAFRSCSGNLRTCPNLFILTTGKQVKEKIKSLLPSLRLSKKLKWAQTLPCCSVGPASVQVLERQVVCAHKQPVVLNAEGTACAHAPTVHAGTRTRQRQTHRSRKAMPPTARARGGSGAGRGDGWAVGEGAPGLTPAPLL